MSQLPGHIQAFKLLYQLMIWAVLLLLVAPITGAYFWVCGAVSPAQCARAHGYVPASEISTTKGGK